MTKKKMSRFFHTNKNDVVDLEEFRMFYITSLPAYNFKPTDQSDPPTKRLYCVDGDWKKGGSLTLACFKEEENNDKSALERAEGYLSYISNILGYEECQDQD